MRWTMERQLLGMVLLLGTFSLVGCNAGKPAPTATAKGTKDGVAEQAPLRKLADGFVQKLAEGKVTPDELTVNFKKTISRPTTEEEKKVGYSDADVKQWLSRLEKITLDDPIETTLENGLVLRGRAKTPGKIDAFCIRIVRDGLNAKIDWLHRAERFYAGTPLKFEDNDLAVAYDTARNFLETMLGGDLRQAQAVMNPAWLTSIEPPSDADKKNGFTFNVGFVNQKMRSWRGETVGYSMPKGEMTGNKDGATITAELEAAGEKKTYLVKLIKDKKSGQWLVDDFAKP